MWPSRSTQTDKTEPDGVIGRVILFQTGQIQESDVKKIGPYGYACWYGEYHKAILRRDGTAKDGPCFIYKWTRAVDGPVDREQDIAWFDANFLDPGEFGE